MISDEAGPSTKPDPSDTTGGAAAAGSSEKDDSFREFRRLCADIAEENTYTGKTAIVTKFITKGSSAGMLYSKTCLKRPLPKRPQIGFQDQLLLNAGQKYCRMLQGDCNTFDLH